MVRVGGLHGQTGWTVSRCEGQQPPPDIGRELDGQHFYQVHRQSGLWETHDGYCNEMAVGAG